MPRPPTMVVLLALALCACDGPSPGPRDGGGPPVDFTVGALSFHVSGGGAVQTASGFTLYLSSELDTCTAVKFLPMLPFTLITMQVAPASNGLSQAAVVTGKVIPGPGEAVVKLTRALQGTQQARYDAEGGSVVWVPNDDGSVTLTSLDLGFTGAGGRVTTGGLRLPACP